ncbi:tetratricopeptide repeat protein [Deinococcus maricopensis]|uniref:Tetratricopeptide TPR_1 repeat-containing protein n=1 Tax=Deinococcus maricopensis (strain DSM 21211 / LMG 22137 / NRRL B-23946 / LB-34) TaxID=709986 RepID=E8U8C8_DEIML|nr:tetratricopeptide repeat protein [Deinococcus maricopensis]ADV67317.1 Tetratricopeptide TPR_1 repeat-containing protein [Deinococcus maricopensis DSM 21211]
MAHSVPTILLTACLTLGVASAQATPTSTPPAPTAPSVTSTADLSAAQRALQEGRYRDAQTAFEALIARDYNNAEAHFGLGLTLYALGDLTGARFEFTQLTALAPDRFEGFYNLGVLAARQGQYDEALANYQKALTLAQGKASPTSVRQVLDALAGEQTRRGDYPGLITTLTATLALAPNDAALQLRLADAQYRAGNGTQALPALYALLQANPANADAAQLLADVYTAQNLPDRAIRELDKAVAATPNGTVQARLLLRKADLLARQNRTRDAVLAVQDAVKADSRNAAAQARLGELLLARNDRTGARTAYQNAARLDPQNASYRASLALVELNLAQYDAARRDAQLAVQAAPDQLTLARAQFVLGVAAYRQGQYAQARSALQSSALKVPDAETNLWLGLASYALKDYAGAITALEASAKVNPSVNARQNLGAALLAAGRYQEAEATLRGVVTDAPKTAIAWYQLGWTLRNLDREAEARTAFRTALNLGYTQARGALR